MDEELRAYLDAMQHKFNDAIERLLNRMALLEQAFQGTKGFLINDALVAGRGCQRFHRSVGSVE